MMRNLAFGNMKMRHDDVLHVLELVPESLDLVVDRPVLREMDRQVACDLAPIAHGVVHDLRVAAGVEQHEPLRMLDQVRGTRHRDEARIAPVHQKRARDGQLRAWKGPHAFHLRFGHRDLLGV
jgi:hypothetical protein